MSAHRPNVADPGRIIAHRGASMVCPENTLAAFRAAHAQGTRWVEFDVSLLGDGTAVVHHDATLDRCTNTSGPLARYGAADLSGIDAGQGEPLPRLDQVLDLLDDLQMFANLEIKPHDIAAPVLAETVTAALSTRPWARQRIIVSSFAPHCLQALRGLMPQIPIAVLFADPPEDWTDTVQTLNAAAMHLNFRNLRQDILDQARQYSIDVRVFTINEPDLMVPYRDTGLTGVITDHPPLFLQQEEWAGWART